MGYRIDYQPVKKVRGMERKVSRTATMTMTVFLIFLLLVDMLWPEGQRILRGLLFGGDPAVTVMALETLSQELRQGTGLAEALGNFCRYVLSYAH